MLAIAAGQWAMFHFLSKDIANQVREQSKDLSKELAVFAADAMNIQGSGNVFKSVMLQSDGDNHAEVNIEVTKFDEKKAVVRELIKNNAVEKEFIEKEFIKKEFIEKESGPKDTDQSQAYEIETGEIKTGEMETSSQPKMIKQIIQNTALGDGRELRIETISKLVRSQIEATELHFDSKQDRQSVWVFHSSSEDGAAASKRIEIKDNTNMLLDQLKQMGLMIMVITWVLGIGFIYWISHQFTAPLRALDAGYQKLSEGDTQVTVPVKGTSEIQQAIQGFNQMTKKLAFFHQQQQDIKDKMHLAEIGEVSRGIAHALRNPLHTIGLALDKVFDQSQSSYESGIRQKLKLMDKTIQALLNLSVSGAERTKDVAIKPVIQDIIMEMQLTEGVDVKFDLDIESDLRLIGSDSEVRSMLHTLIVNAVEASPAQSNILIKASRNAQREVTIMVEDQGAGLAEEVIESLFEPHITTKAEGAGMGLYIARRLAQLMYNGEIHLQNKGSSSDVVDGCVTTLILNDANNVVSHDASTDSPEDNTNFNGSTK
jgi:signal transduction histidine kinase